MSVFDLLIGASVVCIAQCGWTGDEVDFEMAGSGKTGDEADFEMAGSGKTGDEAKFEEGESGKTRDEVELEEGGSGNTEKETDFEMTESGKTGDEEELEVVRNGKAIDEAEFEMAVSGKSRDEGEFEMAGSGKIVDEGEIEVAGNGQAGEEAENLIRIGSYVLVRFVSNKRTGVTKEYKYVAVCQGPVGEDSEVEVMFMKPIKASAKGDTFVMDENDTCYINTSQVLNILKDPSVKTCGNRIYYEFTDGL